jgi:biotin carboxylase
MRNDRLLMCMPYKQLVRKAVAAGFEVHSIWDPRLETPEYLDEVAATSASMAYTDFDDLDGLRRVVAAAATRHDVAHVLHLGREATQQAVCEQADALGLALNSPESIRRLNDKAAMRALLREHHLSPVRSMEASSPAEAAPRLRVGDNLPVVVKPTGLDGSRAVRLIGQPADVDPWLDELAACNYDGPVLIEEELRGPEFSVETLTAHGTHHVIGITGKRLGARPHFVEMGHVHPVPLPAETHESIVELVVAYLDATGYRFGPAHTEVILTAYGPRIVESQARIGGDRIPLLIEVARGFDIEAAVFRALAGGPVEPGPAHRLGCIAFFDFGTGLVRSVTGVEEVLRLPFVHDLKVKVKAGDRLSPVVSSQARHGYVVVDAGTEEQAALRVTAVRECLHVEVDPAVTRIHEGMVTHAT